MDVAKYRIKNDYFQILPSKSRKVILLEDRKGESHLRNLSLQKVSSEQEAMKLLFLGDTNRIIAETPMNVCSSRSHCIFTICVTSKNSKSGRIRRSKLNLVDLAGSERIYKSNITGTTLNEAKYINLSLHYLEQVVLALSQKRSHVPFRNSMLTYMLRDSLSGNCVTVLLATLAVNKKNIYETIATCKFAQRVAEVNLEAVINEEFDPQQEIEYLKREIESLRLQLLQQSKFKISGKLSKEEKEKWKKAIANYLIDAKDELPLANFDLRHIQYCFKLLKEAVRENEEKKLKMSVVNQSSNRIIEEFKKTIEEKEEEIAALKSLLYADGWTDKLDSNLKIKTNSSYLDVVNENDSPSPSSDSLDLSPAQRVAFQIFLQNPRNRPEIDYYKHAIQEIYEIAKNLASIIEECQNKILNIKSKHQACTDRILSAEMDLELLNQQSIYRNSLTKLQELKKETEYFKKGMEQAKLNVLESFKLWYDDIGRKEYNDDKFEALHSDSFKKEFLKDDNNEFKTIWKQSGDNTFGVETPNLLCRTPCSPDNAPFEGPIVGRVDDMNIPETKIDSKYATHKEYSRSRNRQRSPFPSDVWKTKSSNFSNLFNSLNRDENEDAGSLTEESINNILAAVNLKPFTPSSYADSKEEKHRSKPKSPRKYDYKFPWIQEYNNPFTQNIKERSRSRSPRKFYTFDTFFSNNNNSSHQEKISNNSSNFSVVYQDIMSSNEQPHAGNIKNENMKHLIPERPYSSNSSETPYKTNRDHLNLREHNRNKYWNSHSQNTKLEESNEHSNIGDTILRVLEGKSLNSDSSKSSMNIWEFQHRNSAKENNLFGIKNFNAKDYDTSDLGLVSSSNVIDEESEVILKSLKINSSRSNVEVNKNDGLFLSEDTEEFRNFISTIPLTGDVEVDDEIIKFYRTKFVCTTDNS